MLERMSWVEFVEWMAFYQMEPFGEMRADLRSGIIASTFANCHRDPDKQREPFKASDFMPQFDRKPETRTQDPRSMHQFLMMLKGAQDLKKKRAQGIR